MEARLILARLRDGARLTPDEIAWFARGLASGEVTDAQAGAFAMGVVTRGLGEGGAVALTRAMRDSGRVLSWDMPGPVLDKHSTGGLGDCTSLLIAPMLAACGAYVPMISGRGLGHTGGTLDKLEAIAGLTTRLGEEGLRAQVAREGCAIVAASGDLAPADRRLYGVRDVTGTVESLELICASILSKKLAAGVHGLVLDVKCGSGAFMATHADAESLARALVETAKGAGTPTLALITDMNQPLAPAMGNGLEVAEVVRVLTGEGPGGALLALSRRLAGEALVLGGLATDLDGAVALIDRHMASGEVAERFQRMVAAQGGARDLLRRPSAVLPRAAVTVELAAPRAGWLRAIDGVALGHGVVALGGGRRRDGDEIDRAVGLSRILPLGSHVEAGQPLALIHAAERVQAEALMARLARAFHLGDEADPAGAVAPGHVLQRIH